MSGLRIKLIAAVSNYMDIIGRKGEAKLLWRVPEDLNYFKSQTMGKVVIMGHNTYKSLAPRTSLPGRHLIVVTHKPKAAMEDKPLTVDFMTMRQLNTWLDHNPQEVWVAGGASMYETFIDRADEVHRTCIPPEIWTPDLKLDPVLSYVQFPWVSCNQFPKSYRKPLHTQDGDPSLCHVTVHFKAHDFSAMAYLCSQLSESLSKLSEFNRKINLSNGWGEHPASVWDTDPRIIMSNIAMIHEEVAEMSSACRKADLPNFREECADVMIRLLDITHTLNIDLASEVLAKLKINADRPGRHGGKRL